MRSRSYIFYGNVNEYVFQCRVKELVGKKVIRYIRYGYEGEEIKDDVRVYGYVSFKEGRTKKSCKQLLGVEGFKVEGFNNGHVFEKLPRCWKEYGKKLKVVYECECETRRECETWKELCRRMNKAGKIIEDIQDMYDEYDIETLRSKVQRHDRDYYYVVSNDVKEVNVDDVELVFKEK